ncbi:MAG: NAD(P)H-dependent glycerol-3-phosphate dehydrogenase [Candidatus Cloacimonetes bacterium]|nr:NAD(P)H-dependent glycerol-3-phosphate dehydrogenase [Candidatus Cloacimonadota bacterium]
MRIIVIGAGNWGSTLGALFAAKNEVILWTLDEAETQALRPKHKELLSLGSDYRGKSIIIEPKYSRKILADDLILIAIPSRRISSLVGELKERGVKENIILNVSKGVKHTTLSTMREIVLGTLPDVRFAVLSGPTIASEIKQGLPAKAVLASNEVALLFQLQQVLTNDLLYFEFSRDVKGIELCASLKGLIAIAVGIADGLGYSTNIFGLIMTFGLREFTTVLEFLGVQTKTVYGIAGMGDLITTCLSENSRNRRFGKLLAEGKTREEALKEVGMVVEGVSMAKTIRKLAQFNLHIPLISLVAEIVFDETEDVRRKFLDTLFLIH